MVERLSSREGRVGEGVSYSASYLLAVSPELILIATLVLEVNLKLIPK